MINANFIKNDFLETLCLNISIPTTAPIVPPKKVNDNRVDSGILRWGFTALRLSIPKRIKLMMLMNVII